MAELVIDSIKDNMAKKEKKSFLSIILPSAV